MGGLGAGYNGPPNSTEGQLNMLNAQPVLDWQDVDSSNVRRVAFLNNHLCVEFHNGGLYAYHHVSLDVYHDMVGAASVGHYLAHVIKAMYPYTKFYTEDELNAFLLRV